MINLVAEKNRSQLSEIKINSDKERRKSFRKKLGTTRLDSPGIMTPLGHSYSLILEELSREGLDSTPRPKEFLEYVDKREGHANVFPLELGNSPTFYPNRANAVWRYMVEKGLSPESCENIMDEIVGPGFYEFTAEYSRRFNS